MNNHQPFNYDFEDFAGSKYFTKLFVTKVMNTHTGQCRSLPMYYKILAEELNTEAYITFALQHIFIRHRDEQDSGKLANVELTTQSLSHEIFYIEKFGITDDTIRSKQYMYPLSNKETVAYILAELAYGYYRKYGKWDYFVMQCAELSLLYYPSNQHAFIYKGNVINGNIIRHLQSYNFQKNSIFIRLDNQWFKNNEKLRELGWRKMTDKTYEALLKETELEKNIMRVI